MSQTNGRIEKLLTLAETATKEKTSVAEAEREFDNVADAETIFHRLCDKLCRINRWNDESGAMGFTLFDDSAREMPEKKAAVGDFVRISLPGTGKYDWVKITDIFSAPSETVLTVRPTFDPTDNSPDKSATSHFFTDDSTNNFCLRLDGAKIKMYVIGLNEVTNTDETAGFIEAARNLATANLGHYFGVQTAAWTTFCRNFLEIEEK